MINFFLVFVIFLLQIADGLTTKAILFKGGREANPIMRYLFAKIGFWQTVAAKIIIIPLLAWYAGFYGAVAISIIYILVVGNNIKVILDNNSKS